MDQIKYALFIEPQGSLLEFIKVWKEKCEAFFPDAPYLSHPPHSTLLFTYFKSVDRTISLLEKVRLELSPILLNCHEMMIFENDTLAGGGHTLTIRADLNQQLINFQTSLAEIVEPEIDHGHEVLPDALDQGVFANSFRRFGFPFVGQHWIPHFSIASIKSERNHPFICDFESQDLSCDLKVDEFSLWEVKGDEHCKIQAFKMGAL